MENLVQSKINALEINYGPLVIVTECVTPCENKNYPLAAILLCNPYLVIIYTSSFNLKILIDD